jgi:hypothetical protein
MLLFALENLSICDDEALEFHIPLLLTVITSSLQVYILPLNGLNSSNRIKLKAKLTFFQMQNIFPI